MLHYILLTNDKNQNFLNVLLCYAMFLLLLDSLFTWGYFRQERHLCDQCLNGGIKQSGMLLLESDNAYDPDFLSEIQGLEEIIGFTSGDVYQYEGGNIEKYDEIWKNLNSEYYDVNHALPWFIMEQSGINVCHFNLREGKYPDEWELADNEILIYFGGNFENVTIGEKFESKDEPVIYVVGGILETGTNWIYDDVYRFGMVEDSHYVECLDNMVVELDPWFMSGRLTYCVKKGYFVVLNVIHIRNKQMDAKKEQQKERYATSIVYHYDWMASDETAQKPDFEHLKITKGNVIFVFNTVVGNGYSIAPIHLVVVGNEPLAEELKEGRFPTDNEIAYGRKCVVIGEGLKRLTEDTETGEVLRIDGIPYDVIGTLKDITGDGADSRVIVYQNCLAGASIYGLNGEWSYYIEYGSNASRELQTDQLLIWMHRFIPNSKLEVSEDEQVDTMDEMRTTAQLFRQYIKFVLYGLFGFCLIGCTIVSTIWIKRRRKEMIIRKAFGSGMTAIAAVLLRDLIVMLGIALLISFVTVFLQSLISGELWFQREYMVSNLFFLFAVVLLVILFTFLRPLYMACKINPAEGTRE